MANSKAEIDAMSKFSDEHQFHAAVQATGLKLLDIGAGAEGGRKNIIEQKGGAHEEHVHAAIILTGKVGRGAFCYGESKIDVAIQLCVEEKEKESMHEKDLKNGSKDCRRQWKKKKMKTKIEKKKKKKKT